MPAKGKPTAKRAAKRKVVPAERPPPVVVGDDQVMVRNEGALREPPNPNWWIVAPLALVACLVLFNLGHDAIDQPEPDTGRAGILYGAVLLAGAATVAVLFALRAPSLPVLLLASLLFGGLWALLTYGSTEAYNDEEDWFSFSFLFWPFLLFAAILVVTVVVVIVRRPHYGLRVLASALLSGAFAYVWLALVHITQLDRQAELAREAYERDSPGAGVVLLVLGLLATALLARRLKR